MATYQTDSRLTSDAAWDFLATQDVGRVVTRIGDVVDIFPVTYAVDGRSVVFRTAEGSKLFELTANAEVLFEVDDHTEDEACSVIIRGRAGRIESAAEKDAAAALPLRPFSPTRKDNLVRVVASEISGRAFVRSDPADGELG